MSGILVEHRPVLLKESLELLEVKAGGVYVDGTVGLGGHAEGILERLGPSGKLIGLDRDATALRLASERLRGRFSNFEFYNENFKNLPLLLRRLAVRSLDGCLLDLGVSSLQLDTTERGFTFREEGPLDMRMDLSQKTTAANLVNELPEEKLAEIFREYGEERAARRIAAAIVEQRRAARLRTTTELARLVERVKGRVPGSRLHPATLVFQALRIEVNQELKGLEELLEWVIEVLAPGGRLVVISFHSLEDRIVKKVMQKQSGKCICFRPGDLCVCPRIERMRVLTRKPITPSEEETEANPRARSGKLRAAERLETEQRS
jgi:16S rRNA (cytosine1402-N4)-methyltransferase